MYISLLGQIKLAKCPKCERNFVPCSLHINFVIIIVPLTQVWGAYMHFKLHISVESLILTFWCLQEGMRLYYVCTNQQCVHRWTEWSITNVSIIFLLICMSNHVWNIFHVKDHEKSIEILDSKDTE